MLIQLAARQEEYRGILREIRGREDKSMDDALAGAVDLDEDSVVACACVLFELSHDHDREPVENDIFWSVEFLDHLDTLGFKLARK